MNLESMNTTELLTRYNVAAKALGKPTVNRFSDRNTAVKRTKAILNEQAAAEPKEDKPFLHSGERAVSAPKAAAAKKATAPSGGKAMTFSFPAGKTVKRLREGTKREAIHSALRKGATFDQVQAVVVAYDKENPPSKPRTPETLASFTYEAIRLLHLYCGFGLHTEGGDVGPGKPGKIFVTGGE